MVMVSREEWAARLEERGLASSDAVVVADDAFGWRDPHAPARPLLEGFEERHDEAERRAIFDVVIEAQARGPVHADRAVAWRRVYEAGCPMDNIHRVLWHAFQAPDSNIQDQAWVPLAQALRTIAHYEALDFPRVGAMEYGVGLGCERLWTNTRDGHRRLLEHGAPYPMVLRSLDLCRNVFSPRLRARVDAAAGLKPVLKEPTIDRLPWQTEQLSEETVLGDVDDGGAESDVDPVAAWFAVAEDLMSTGEIVHDVGADRFALADEPLTPRKCRPRDPPLAPRERPESLQSLLDAWHAHAEPWVSRVLVESLDFEDPMLWLTTVAEMTLRQ